MTDLGAVERSDSPYCSPVVSVNKKDNSNRFCIDFRVLNKITVFDAMPMPSVEQIFSKFAGYKFISKGYWQIPLSEHSKKYTAFQTPLGLFQFTVLQFGLVTAQASCSRLMRKLLQNLQNVDNFVDDIIIFTLTSPGVTRYREIGGLNNSEVNIRRRVKVGSVFVQLYFDQTRALGCLTRADIKYIWQRKLG